MSARADVLVVGAGLSGLTAAYRLDRAGLEVRVLEARDRVGGRAWRLPVGDAWFDAGCEALDHEHAALMRLAGELGVATWEAPPWSSEPPPGRDGDDLSLFQEFEREIEALAAQVDSGHPEDTERAGELDRLTLAGWLEARGASAATLAAAEVKIAVASSSLPLAEMSMLAYAAKLAAGAAPTGLTLRFEGGPSAVAESLAAALGGRVRVGSPVAAVEDRGSEALVRLADGTQERADRVVVALPLTLQRELRFDPPLPEPRRRALAEARYGSVVKEAALFDRDAPLPSPDLSEDGHFYVAAHEPRLLIRFAGARASERAVSMGPLAGRDPQAGATVSWAEERWTRGSYLILGPGQLLDWGGILGEPHGRVHFAGSERSTLKSYMEGAVRAGDEVADEILAARA